ncbi:MAG TPA: hypothetical protein PLZ57_01950 [Pseudobdellovibrionaceae bacterium]|nr:hypothetical protein [Pseudobdellovibrionaceae bacterium]
MLSRLNLKSFVRSCWRRVAFERPENFSFLSGKFLVAALLSASAWVPAWAMDSTQVLPVSVNSPSIRMGVVSGLGMKFTGSGELMTLNDLNSVEFDVKMLSQFEPRVRDLVGVLNQFGAQRFGDELHLGTLRVNTSPEVRYLAPVYARGVNEKWTLAIGMPVLTYTNRLRLEQTGGNLQAIRDQVGTGSAELNTAFEQLNINLANAAHAEIAKKGYKPLGDRAETLYGDMQLASLYQFLKREAFSAQLKTIVSLPTGEGNDPDDLADLGAYGYTAVENQLLANLRRGRALFAVKGGYRYVLPDRVMRRVPRDEGDSLPDADTKERVQRATGGTAFVGAASSYEISEALNVAIGYEHAMKSADTYAGREGRRYDLLERETASQVGRMRLGMSYSSVSAFFAGTALLPAVVAYEFSDTISGFNTERMSVHELWLQIFF